QIVLLRQMENADEIDRITLEAIRLCKQDAVLVDDEVFAFGKLAPLHRPQALHDAAEYWHALGVAVFQFGAQDSRQVADILGDEEVVLDEALDVLKAGMLGVAESQRDLPLDVERQPLFGATHEKMHVTAHGP